MIFTNPTGERVNVPEGEYEPVESTPNYTVYQTNTGTNPGGVLTKVVYNNPRIPLDGMEDLKMNVGGMGTTMPDYMMQEESGMSEMYDNMTPADEFDEVGRNPPGTAGSAVMGWRNLRLQSAIDGERRVKGRILGTGAKLARKFSNFKGLLNAKENQNTSRRPYPEMLMLATAETWYDYVRNMNPLDISAELSYEVSPQDQLSIYGFIKEWESDPSHRAFRRRVNPGADINSEFAKGQIAYDLMTAKAPNAMKGSDFSSHRYDKMFGLALDILKSTRLNIYNYYTLNAMHNDEGDRVFMDFRSRYIPLGAAHVEMIQEMQENIAGGKSYAFQTTASQDQALEADLLMRKCVSAYQVGDTRTCRSILDVLMAHPFNYKPMSTKLALAHHVGANAGIDPSTGKAKDSGQVKFEAGEIFRVSAGGKNNPLAQDQFAKYLEGNMAFVSVSQQGKKGAAIMGKLKSGNLGKPNEAEGAQLILHKSYFDTTPVAVLESTGGKWALTDYSAFLNKGTKTFEDKKQRDKRKQIQQAVKPNPVGRGKFLFMEIHPKSQLKMKRGSGEEKHGQSKDTAKWTKGLNKHFPGIKLVQVGKLKATGEDAPFRIRLPISHFKPVTHPTKGYKTIGMKKGDKKLQATWQKIVDTYGMPKMASVKGTYYRFIIDKTERGSYYDGVRRKTGKAKASR
jgi:hypothetical protein